MGAKFSSEDHKIVHIFGEKRKMTLENCARASIAIFISAVAIASGIGLKSVNYQPGAIGVHIFFAIAAVALIARVIYKYVKGE